MRVAVVCAPQTFGCNAGMYSVDLAAWYLLTKHFPRARVTYSTLYPHRCDFGDTPFPYASQTGDVRVLRESDVILYWGDFLHALHYRNEVASQLLAQGICSSADRALGMVRSYLFLAEGGSELLGKAILYGGTLLLDPADAYEDALYANDLKRLMRSARGVWMREPFSAFRVSQLQGRLRSCAHGTDCAQLLGRDFAAHCAIGAHPSRSGAKSRLGIFFGRSHLGVEPVAAFVSAIAAGLRLDLSWLDWGRTPFFLDRRGEFLERLPQAIHNSAGSNLAATPLESLAALQGLEVLISDTYHACVNAWSFGIPAICLVDDSDTALPVNSGAGGRDKRVVFYWTYNAGPFLVYASELGREAPLRKRAMETVSLLSDRRMIAQIRSQMSKHVRMSEESLVRTLRA
jgi:hypothetical protein